ncbi:uncharacterized protein BcabD6B2_15490 [Babesia caballi]|uniref:Uncharacterized protein n=1 Tax=Babesia caballi TaxID=5871 RepID=A0AAV4LTU2_BABCB|nr:hypothetical protein BcabD6B2_15490 [Babesia caballi]
MSNSRRIECTGSRVWADELVDFGDEPRCHRLTTLPKGKAKTLVDRHGMQKLDVALHVVARRRHFNVALQMDGAANVASADEGLRPVVGDEGVLAATLLRGEHVEVGVEFGVALVGAGLNEHEPTLNLVALYTLEEHADLVAGDPLAEALAEHLEAHAHGLLAGLGTAADLNGVADLDLALLDATSDDGALAGDGEDVVDGDQEGEVALPLGSQQKLVAGRQQLLNGLDVGLSGAVERLHCAALDDGGGVAVVAVLAEQLPDLKFHELEQLGVLQHVQLVEENHQAGHADLLGEQDVLLVGVTRAIHVAVVPVLRFVLYVGGVDGDAALALLRRPVDGLVRRVLSVASHGADLGQCRRERSLAMVHMADGADVEVFLVSHEGSYGEVPLALPVGGAPGERQVTLAASFTEASTSWVRRQRGTNMRLDRCTASYEACCAFVETRSERGAVTAGVRGGGSRAENCSRRSANSDRRSRQQYPCRCQHHCERPIRFCDVRAATRSDGLLLSGNVSGHRRLVWRNFAQHVHGRVERVNVVIDVEEDVLHLLSVLRHDLLLLLLAVRNGAHVALHVRAQVGLGQVDRGVPVALERAVYGLAEVCGNEGEVGLLHDVVPVLDLLNVLVHRGVGADSVAAHQLDEVGLGEEPGRPGAALGQEDLLGYEFLPLVQGGDESPIPAMRCIHRDGVLPLTVGVYIQPVALPDDEALGVEALARHVEEDDGLIAERSWTAARQKAPRDVVVQRPALLRLRLFTPQRLDWVYGRVRLVVLRSFSGQHLPT